MDFLEEVPAAVRGFLTRQHEFCDDGESKACLELLANDSRMRHVYKWLAKKKFTGRQQRDFIACAWVAQQNFEQYREDLAKAKGKAGEIAKAARALAQNIEGFARLGIEDGQGEIPARLGDIHQALQDRGLAPFMQWLETLAQAFDGFDKDSAVSGSYLVKAATPTQEHAELTTYLRAFVEALRVHEFPLRGASEAMAATAEIVLRRDETIEARTVQRIIKAITGTNKNSDKKQ